MATKMQVLSAHCFRLGEFLSSSRRIPLFISANSSLHLGEFTWQELSESDAGPVPMDEERPASAAGENGGLENGANAAAIAASAEQAPVVVVLLWWRRRCCGGAVEVMVVLLLLCGLNLHTPCAGDARAAARLTQARGGRRPVPGVPRRAAPAHRGEDGGVGTRLLLWCCCCGAVVVALLWRCCCVPL